MHGQYNTECGKAGSIFSDLEQEKMSISTFLLHRIWGFLAECIAREGTKGNQIQKEEVNLSLFSDYIQAEKDKYNMFLFLESKSLLI